MNDQQFQKGDKTKFREVGGALHNCVKVFNFQILGLSGKDHGENRGKLMILVKQVCYLNSLWSGNTSKA